MFGILPAQSWERLVLFLIEKTFVSKIEHVVLVIMNNVTQQVGVPGLVGDARCHLSANVYCTADRVTLSLEVLLSRLWIVGTS